MHGHGAKGDVPVGAIVGIHGRENEHGCQATDRVFLLPAHDSKPCEAVMAAVWPITVTLILGGAVGEMVRDGVPIEN
ncbi:hypothetical protein [Bradyrhizobium japonicum]|uniref:hypothetical protein n=1 Tax=Bradyrhizobium japonicum TaxID=375 RepID=UPI001BA9329C|nr:hypothetical protein [Bradyrhizobium japonicum]MBR0910493.1 hypothetical protein [Bradyrhizobium japonicum]